jgi:hypothetical protein
VDVLGVQGRLRDFFVREIISEFALEVVFPLTAGFILGVLLFFMVIL